LIFVKRNYIIKKNLTTSATPCINQTVKFQSLCLTELC
jgi:hypothetical protein